MSLILVELPSMLCREMGFDKFCLVLPNKSCIPWISKKRIDHLFGGPTPTINPSNSLLLFLYFMNQISYIEQRAIIHKLQGWGELDTIEYVS